MAADRVDDATRGSFEAWQSAAPEHAAAYADVEATWQLARELRETPPLLSLRHETSTRLVAATRHLMRRLGMAAGLAAAVIGLGTGAYLGHQVYQRRVASSSELASEVYQTRVGERMALTLVDGSKVTLNTASRLRVVYSETERRLVLEAGQALFRVAKGQAQPFIVTAGGQRITAHGTEFDVRLDRDSIKVALVEGIVSVQDENKPSTPEIRLKPNEVLAAGADVRSVRAVPDMERLVSWQDGLLIFEDESLGAAVAEMNRYVRRPIILSDPSLAKLRISGAFRAGSTRTFVDAVTHLFPVTIVENTADSIVLATTPQRPAA